MKAYSYILPVFITRTIYRLCQFSYVAMYICAHLYYPIDMIAIGVDILFDGYINDVLAVNETFQVYSYALCGNDKYICNMYTSIQI